MQPDMSVATEATHSDVVIARRNTSLSKNTTYQRNEKPLGGKVKKAPALKLASTTIAIGANKKPYTSQQ